MIKVRTPHHACDMGEFRKAVLLEDLGVGTVARCAFCGQRWQIINRYKDVSGSGVITWEAIPLRHALVRWWFGNNRAYAWCMRCLPWLR
jgi:hypothetical protein